MLSGGPTAHSNASEMVRKWEEHLMGSQMETEKMGLQKPTEDEASKKGERPGAAKETGAVRDGGSGAPA